MKKLLAVILIIQLLILSACNVKYFSFEGENDNWFAKQEMSIIEERQESKIIIKYIGEELDKVKNTQVTYYFEDRFGSNSGSRPLTKGGVLETSASCSKCDLLKEDDEIHFTIEWGNGNKESFPLTYK